MYITLATTYPVAPPELFNFKYPTEWTKWIRRFKRFKSASRLNEKPEEVQVNALLYTMGANADDILQSFELSDDNKVEKKSSIHTSSREGTSFTSMPCSTHENKKVEMLRPSLPHYICW